MRYESQYFRSGGYRGDCPCGLRIGARSGTRRLRDQRAGDKGQAPDRDQSRAWKQVLPAWSGEEGQLLAAPTRASRELAVPPRRTRREPAPPLCIPATDLPVSADLEKGFGDAPAAAQAARALPFAFTLTARAENFLRGNPSLDDTITTRRAGVASATSRSSLRSIRSASSKGSSRSRSGAMIPRSVTS